MNDPGPCPECPGKYRPIPGDGPQPCRVLLLAERPGDTERRQNRVLVGKAGQELDHTYLPLAGLRRCDVRATNAVRCFADANRTPTPREIMQCARHHLPGELEATQPEVVLLLGSSACSLVPGIKLDVHHGAPREAALFGRRGVVVPMYHPALGLHVGRWMTPMLEDWRSLNCELNAAVAWLPNDVRSTPRYELLRGELAGLWPRIAVDSESHAGVPWSVQWSGARGIGYILRADDRRGIGKFAAWVREEQLEMIFHNALADIPVLEKLGIPVPRYRDTMQEAYHLGNLPQALKELAFRLFRVEMQSWAEIVRPASIRALLEWLSEALVVAHKDLYRFNTVVRKTCVCGKGKVAHEKGKGCGDYRPRAEAVPMPGDTEGLLNRLIRYTDEDAEYDPWERLDEFWAEDRIDAMHLQKRIGRYPALGIANCSEADAVRYACSDADHTLRVAVELERRRGERPFAIDPADRDI